MPVKAFIVDHNIHETVCIAISEDSISSILKYLHLDNVTDEWRQIRDILKQGIRNPEKYLKCKVSDSANNMFEMRFTNKGKNDRIYCQELSVGKKRVIVMCELLEGKKTQNIPPKIKNRINTLSKNKYEVS